MKYAACITAPHFPHAGTQRTLTAPSARAGLQQQVPQPPGPALRPASPLPASTSRHLPAPTGSQRRAPPARLLPLPPAQEQGVPKNHHRSSQIIIKPFLKTQQPPSPAACPSTPGSPPGSTRTPPPPSHPQAHSPTSSCSGSPPPRSARSVLHSSW
mgnify:CR=1 FL=1